MDLYEVFKRSFISSQERLPVAHASEGFPKWYTVYSYFAKWKEPDQDGIRAFSLLL